MISSTDTFSLLLLLGDFYIGCRVNIFSNFRTVDEVPEMGFSFSE